MGRSPRMTLERLADLSNAALRTEWAHYFQNPAPALSPDLLRLGIAYKMQAIRSGDIDRATRAFLQSIPKAGNAAMPKPRRKLSPGTLLVRDWHGVGYSVTVLDNGFGYAGREWSSLSAIAHAITGTKWNGPRFFGLSEQNR